MKPILLALFSLLLVTACATQQKDSGSWSADKVEQGKELCSAMSKGATPGRSKFLNDEGIRQAVYECRAKGLLAAIPGQVVTYAESGKEVSVKPTDLGEYLEEQNIWYYYPDDDGKDVVGLNIFNKTDLPLTSVELVFSPLSCDQAEEKGWDVLMRVDLEKPLASGQSAIIEWTMPENGVMANGCMDILDADLIEES